MKKKLVLWYDPWNEWFSSILTLIGGVITVYILFSKMPIRMNKGRLSIGEIIELCIAAIPIIILIWKFVSQLYIEKDNIVKYSNCLDWEKKRIIEGNLKEESKKRLHQYRINQVYEGCMFLFAWSVIWYLLLTIITKLSILYLILSGIILFFTITFAISIGQRGFGSTLSSLGNAAIDIANDLIDCIPDSPTPANESISSGRFMSSVGKSDEWYVSSEDENYRYIEDSVGNKKRLYKSDGYWFDEEGFSFEDL